MKLPKSRALALLGLLTLAGMLTPREGAALRMLWLRDDPPGHIAGDPEEPGATKGWANHYFFRGASSRESRLALTYRFIAQLVGHRSGNQGRR